MNQGTNPAPQENHTAPESAPVAAAPLLATGEKKTLMAVLAYISILILIPYFTSKDDAFVKFHIKQGLVLIVIGLIIWVGGEMAWGLKPLWGIANLAVFILSIIGIINAIQGKEKEIPLVGQFAKHFNNI